MKKLTNLLFVLILFPYISIYPIGTDIQPLVGIISFLIILILTFQKKLKVVKFDIFFFSITLISLLSVSFENGYELRKTIGIFFAFLIYLAVKNTKQYFSFKVFYYSVWVYFVGALFQIFTNGLFNSVIGHFVRAIKTDMGARGVTVFCTEPSFLAWMAIFFIFILIYFKEKTNIKITKKEFYIVILINIFLIIASKSGTGILFSTGLLFLYLLFKIKFIYKIISIFLFSSILVYLVVADVHMGRGVDLLKKIVSSPELILYDSSAAVRFSQFYIGALSIINYPLGTGSGSFSITAKKLYEEKHVDKIIPIISQRRVEQELDSAVSTFAKYTIEMGIVFVIFIVSLFVSSSFNIYIMLYVLMSVLLSFPIVFPPIWFLFAVYYRKVRFK